MRVFRDLKPPNILLATTTKPTAIPALLQNASKLIPLSSLKSQAPPVDVPLDSIAITVPELPPNHPPAPAPPIVRSTPATSQPQPPSMPDRRVSESSSLAEEALLLTAKVGDFGLSTPQYFTLKQRAVEVVTWVAPEILQVCNTHHTHALYVLEQQ
jgi:serine/threonine protein kinase